MINNINNELITMDFLEDENNICRICLENISEIEDDPLRSRCQCKSAKYHDSCILKWINTKKSKQCEICKTDFVGIKHAGVTVRLSNNARQLIIISIVVIAFDCVLWAIYFTIGEHSSCKFKNDKRYSDEMREIYANRCRRFNDDKWMFMIVIIIITCVFGSILILSMLLKEQIGMIERIYHNKFVIDKSVIIAKVDIPEHLENEIIEPENLIIEISPDTPGTPDTPENQNSTDSVISI